MKKLIFASLFALMLAVLSLSAPSIYASGKPIGHGGCCDITTTSCPPIIPVCY